MKTNALAGGAAEIVAGQFSVLVPSQLMEFGEILFLTPFFFPLKAKWGVLLLAYLINLSVFQNLFFSVKTFHFKITGMKYYGFVSHLPAFVWKYPANLLKGMLDLK